MNTSKWSCRSIAAGSAVAVATVLLLTACSGETAIPTDAQSEPPAGSKGALAMSFPSQNLSYWNLQLEKMRPIVETAGYEFLTDDPQGNAQTQVADWQSWIARGDVKAIMGFPVDWDAIVPVTAEAAEADIPVIGYSGGWEGVEYTVGVDLTEFAKTIGEGTGAWILENHPGESVKVAIVGNSNTDLGRALTDGFIEGLDSSGAQYEVTELGNDYSRDAAYNAAQSAIVANPDTYIWFGHGPDVLGARQAIIDSGVAADDPAYYISAAATDQELLDNIASGTDIVREAWFHPTRSYAEANAALLICAAEKTCKSNSLTIEPVHATTENAATLEP